MAAISSTSVGAQAATQAGWQQLRVQQARQNAAQAEATARALETRAADAHRVARQAQENARSLSVQSDQAQTAVGQARQGLAMVKTVDEMQTRLSGTVEQTMQRQAVAETNTSPAPKEDVVPVLNTSGQLTGTVVNTTA